jgi:hypothetical protein
MIIDQLQSGRVTTEYFRLILDAITKQDAVAEAAKKSYIKGKNEKVDIQRKKGSNVKVRSVRSNQKTSASIKTPERQSKYVNSAVAAVERMLDI